MRLQALIISKAQSLSAQNFSNKEIAYQIKSLHPSLNGVITEDAIVMLRCCAFFFVLPGIAQGHTHIPAGPDAVGGVLTDLAARNRSEVPMTHEHRERYEPRTPQRREIYLVGPRPRPEGGASPPPLVVAPALGN